MAFTEDTADFINPDTPGYVIATLNNVSVEGLFDNGSANALSGMMLGSNPTFTCASTAAGSASRGQTLVADGVSYTAREAKPDGTGFTLLELEKA